jgi:hypothetical protein
MTPSMSIAKATSLLGRESRGAREVVVEAVVEAVVVVEEEEGETEVWWKRRDVGCRGGRSGGCACHDGRGNSCDTARRFGQDEKMLLLLVSRGRRTVLVVVLVVVLVAIAIEKWRRTWRE